MPPLNLLLTFTLPPDQHCNPGSLMPGQLPRPTSGGSKVMQWWCKYSTAEKKSWARRTNECEECRKSDVHSLLCHFSSERRSVWLSARPTGSPDSSGSEWHHRERPANTLFRLFKEMFLGFVCCRCSATLTFIPHVLLWWTVLHRRDHVRPSGCCCPETGSLCACVFVSFCLQTKVLAFFFLKFVGSH